MGTEKLARSLGVSEVKGKRFLSRYFEEFPAVKRTQSLISRQIENRGYAETLFGRRRPIDSERSYVGLNTIIQGTAADVLKIACLRVGRYLESRESNLILCIHDELVIERALGEAITWDIYKLMVSKFPFELPLAVDIATTRTNWAEKKDIEEGVA